MQIQVFEHTGSKDLVILSIIPTQLLCYFPDHLYTQLPSYLQHGDARRNVIREVGLDTSLSRWIAGYLDSDFYADLESDFYSDLHGDI